LRNNILAQGTQGQCCRKDAESRDEAVSGDAHEVSLEWLLIQRSMRK
jgi:hypothetical protein